MAIPTLRRRVIRATAVVACCLVLLQAALVPRAFKAKATAIQLLQTVDRFRLGVTSKAEAEASLRALKLTTEDEACSAVVGRCEGIGFEVSNQLQLPRGDIAYLLEFAIGKASLFRPTYLVGNFYFNSDRLVFGAMRFSTDKASIGTEFALADPVEVEFPLWRRNNRTGDESYFRSIGPMHQKEVSLGSSDVFDIGCMKSILGCNTPVELWPSISRYKSR